MKTEPIRPARIHFAEGEPPAAPDFGDLYHPRVGALAQARHVFLQGNGLPQRWAGRRDFTVLETGFGLGNNFLALWQAWREDPARCERLHLVSLELHPPRRDDLARAHADSPLPTLTQALLAAWPPLTPGLHRLVFEGGRVQLTLALGDAQKLLPLLPVQADALFLDGFAPDRNPAMWSLPLVKALARRCRPGATAATWSVSRALHEALSAAGFEPRHAPGIGGKREITLATLAPRAAVAPLPAHASTAALVVGAGIAGAHAARALAQLGLAVTVLEAAGAAAQGASGNRAGLFHGTLDADDSPYARLHRSAALWAAQAYREAVAAGVPGQVQGLLRLAAPRRGRTEPQALAERQGLPADYVALLGAEAASSLAGLPLAQACWFYPGGGWISPAAAAAQALRTPGITARFGAGVARLERRTAGWSAVDAAGCELACAPVVVLAAAEGSVPLLAALGQPPLPLARSRGQVTELPGLASGLRLPLAGEGYAIPLPDGLLCGATRHAADEDAALRDHDHALNLERLARLTGIDAAAHARRGRVGWRLQAADRLPVAGAVPLAHLPDGTRQDQARLLPREPGLFVVTALGARGITWAPLLGALVAAQVCGTPGPLEQDLVDALDPGRWLVKRARAGLGD